MKKFNAILDDTTIINFPFFINLMKRYYLTSILIPLAVFSYAAIYYHNQNIIYIKNINFSFKKDNSSAPSTAITSLMGGAPTGLTVSDIMAISKSPDFVQKLSTNIVKDSNFNQISFSPLTAKKAIPTTDEFSVCNGNEECIINAVENKINSFYSLKENPIIDKMMTLKVKALTPKTAEVLLNTIAKSFVEFRLYQQKRSIREQKKTTLQLIEQKKKELAQLHYDELTKQVAQDRVQLKTLSTSIQNLQDFLQKQKMNAEITQTQYEQAKKVARKATDSDQDNLDHLRQLAKKIKNLKQDIRALQLSTKDGDDGLIIKKLKRDLYRKEKIYKQLKAKTRLTTTDQSFIRTKDKQSKSLEFEYKTSKKQVIRTKRELELLKKEQERLISALEKNESIIEKAKPTVEYTRLLNNKLMQLKVMESTLISDIIFDKKASATRAFRRTTKIKVLIFALFVSFFFTFLVIIIRYLSDPRIYDEYELQKTFSDLEVIGKTPEFK